MNRKRIVERKQGDHANGGCLHNFLFIRLCSAINTILKSSFISSLTLTGGGMGNETQTALWRETSESCVWDEDCINFLSTIPLPFIFSLGWTFHNIESAYKSELKRNFVVEGKAN